MFEIVKMIPNGEGGFTLIYKPVGGVEAEATIDAFVAALIRSAQRHGRNQVRAQIRKALEAE